MLELTELDNIDKKYHWALWLTEYSNHPLQEVIKEFTPDTREFFQSSYLYIGEIGSKTICILHYHSELPGPIKFMNIQNLESYKTIFNLNEKEIARLSCEVTRETVIPLNTSDALSKWHLNKIYNTHYFIICDETGFSKEINWDE